MTHEPASEPPSTATHTAAAISGDPNATYALGSSSGESARLQRQAAELAPDSSALLDRVRLGRGDSAIDIGCGPHGIVDLLVERVSPGGRVVALDSDPAHVAMTSGLARARGWAGIEVVQADARSTGLPSDSFDLVHARLVLVTVPDPIPVLTEMVRLARPGGWVAGIEADMETAICQPPHPAFDRICELFDAAFSRNGANPRLGRRLPELYREAGLEKVEVEARAPIYPVGHSRRTLRADLLRAMHPEIVQLGLASLSELEEIDRAVRLHFADPDTLVMSGLIFLCWCHKPVGA